MCSDGAAVEELIEHVPQCADLGVGSIERRQPRGHAFECRPHLDHFDDLLLGLAHDENPAPRRGTQKSLLLEQRHRLADRRATDTERLAQLALVEPALLTMRVDIGVHDRLLEGGIGLLAQGQVGVERLQDQRGGVVGSCGIGRHVVIFLFDNRDRRRFHECIALRARTRSSPRIMSMVGVGMRDQAAELLNDAYQRLDLHRAGRVRGPATSTSCAVRVRRRPRCVDRHRPAV